MRALGPFIVGVITSFARLAAAQTSESAVERAAAPPVPPAVTADARAAEKGAPFVEPENERRGFILDLIPMSVAAPFGSYAEGIEARSFGAGVGVGLLAGVYVTEHVGVLGGINGSVYHQGVSGCRPRQDECGGVRYQFPLLVQYALRNRKEGIYFQAGLGLDSTYRAYAPGGAFTLSSPFDAKFGLGYRISTNTVNDQYKKPSRYSMNIFANLDVGQFQDASGSDVQRGSRFSGELRDQALHYLAEIGLSMHWTP